jgi:hypothetical protein
MLDEVKKMHNSNIYEIQKKKLKLQNLQNSIFFENGNLGLEMIE